MKKIYIPFLLSFFIQYAQTGADIDGDGILDQDDNCINVWNPNLGISSTNGIDFSSLTQRDHDNNGIGDLCDDNYIVINIQENAPIGSVLEFVQFLPSDFSELSQGENFPSDAFKLNGDNNLETKIALNFNSKNIYDIEINYSSNNDGPKNIIVHVSHSLNEKTIQAKVENSEYLSNKFNKYSIYDPWVVDISQNHLLNFGNFLGGNISQFSAYSSGLSIDLNDDNLQDLVFKNHAVFFDGYKFNLGNHLSNSPVYFINNGGYNFTIKENSFENNSIIEGALNALVFDLDGDGIEEVINISEHYHIDYLPYKPLIEKWLSKKEITKNQRFDNGYNLKPTYYKIINNEFVDMFDKINFSGYDDLFFSMYQSTFGDIDNDGDNDIVFGSQIEKLDKTIGGYVLCILRNDGVGNLNLEVYKNPELNNGIFSTSEGFMLLEDLNDDGYKDLIYNISSPNDAGKIAYLKNDANGKFIYDLNNIIIDLPQGMRNAFALDIEGDGKKEIIIFNSSGYGANGYEGTGPPNIIKVFNVSNFEFEDVTQKYFYNDENELNFYSQMASLRLIDLDGDGEKDLVPKFNLEPPSQGYDYTDNAYFGDWNNSKGFQFFRYDKINNKYQIIDIGEIDRNDIDNGGLKFYYNYNDYDISDLNGDGKPEFYRVKAGEPFNPDLEPKVLNGLMIYEIKGLLLNDSDNDGVLDKDDNCPSNPNENQLDSDSDGVGDVCDNCITRSNSNQKDENSNGVGDVCDPELDTDNDGFDGKRHSLGDGVNNANDNCVNIYNKWQRDHDEDGIGDVCDDDVIILWFNYHDDIGKSIDLSEIIDANYSGLKIKDGNSTDFFEIIESEIILKKSLKDENLELLQAKPNTSERGFKPFKIDIEFSQNNNVISKTLIIYINNVLPPKKVVKAKPVDHPSTNIFFERFDLWNPNFNYDGNGYDSTMYPEEYHNNHLDTIIGIDHDRWMDVGFEYLTVPVDLNDDNLKDLLIGDERINVDGYDLTIHQLRDPVYLKNLGNFEFEIYHNSNNNKLVLESPQMLKLTDLDDDNKDELIYFGEHYHAFLWNYGSNLIIKYLENNNLKYGIDFNKDEFKKFSYLSVKNNELVDMRDKIDYSDCPDCLFSIYSHTTGDIDNDGDVDILFGAQTHSTQTNYGEGGGRNLIIARNDGSGNLKLEFLGNGDFETSESDMVLFDINDDNFKDLVFTGNKGLQFMLNNGSGNIEYNYDNVVENWELFELGSRNFKVLDIENDGIEELIVYCSGSFGALSEEGPYNKIEIYVPKENSLERVTDLYFSNNENYMGYYSHSGSFIQYIDLDNDGITDLVPKFENDVEGGRFFKGDWNNSKGFQFFKFDTSTNKYKVVDLGVIGTGYDARINKEEENSLYNNFEFIDLDNDGLLEFIYLTKSHFQIYKFKDLDSDGTPDIFDNDVDGDGVLDVNDNCPSIYNPDQMDSDNDGVGDVCDDPVKYDITPLTFEINENVKVHLIENPFAYLNDDQTRMIKGFVQFGAPFTSDVIQIDLNEDGKLDIINGTILTEDFNGDLVDLGHATLPIYMEHKENFNFSIYMNPNYKEYSLLHAIQDYLISDLNEDGIDELILGGEHLHIMNQGETNTDRAVDWFNHLNTSVDLKNISHEDPQSESKFNRYYSIENGLLIDEVINFNGGSFDFHREMLVSNSGMAIADINNDEKLDVVYHNQAELDGQIVDTYINKGEGIFELRRQVNNSLENSNSRGNNRIIFHDINSDGFKDQIGVYWEDDVSLLKSFLNNQGTIDYNNGIEIDTLFITKDEDVGFDVSITNFNIEDLNNDGKQELVLFINKIHDLGQYNDQDESYKKWESNYPHQLIKVYNVENSSLTDVTSDYFNDTELKNYQNWFYPYLSTNISIDLNYDGHSDIALYSGKQNNRKLNNEDDFYYFLYDPNSNKYSFKSFPGFEKLIKGSEIDTWDIDRVDSDEFDYIDVDGDGDYEIVESSVRFNDKNYMLIIEGSIMDSDMDGVLDVNDNCPEIYNPDQRDDNNNGIGDYCDDEMPDPENMHFELTEIQSENSLSGLIQPYLINNDYEEFFNQGFDIVDFDNDGKLDYATVFYETKREINKAGLGIFSFDIEDDKLTIDLNNVIEIEGEPNANAPDINYLDNDEVLDVFVPTGNYHGEPGTEPDFYNGTSNRPDFLYYKTENSFKVDSLDFTYNGEKYANTSVQKTIQIDEDKSREIAILAYEGAIQGKGAMAIYDYSDQTNRHELVNEIFTSDSQNGDERFNDIHNIDYDNDGLMDLLSLHVQKGQDIDKYFVNIYYGRQYGQAQIDFNSKELIAEFTEDSSKWFIAENEEFTSVIEIEGRHIMFVQFAGKDGSSAKLVAYDLSTKNAFDITSYLFGKEFINKNFDGLGHYWEDIDNDDDLDLIVERLAYPTIFIQNQGRFHPVKFGVEFDESDRPFIWVDLDQDSKYDIISVKSLKHYLAGTIVLDSDEDGVADDLDQCPDTPTAETSDENGCSDSQKDTDNDGVTDDLDQCSDTPTGETSDENGCSDSQKDTDNDGVTDDIDQCPDTPSGAVVDVNGCEVFTLPVQNFKVEVGSATCVGNSDGIINLSIEDASYDYSVTITGRDDVTIAGDSKTASITGLPKGTYTVCFKVDGEDNFEQCFEVEVNEPQALSAFMEVNGQNLNITMSGSSQYSIDVNGNTQITSSNNFETVLSSGLNIIKVYTSLKCQGFVEEQILISEEVYYYPNPTQNDVNILVGGKDENVSVSVLTIDGSLIYSREQHVSNITRKTVLDLSKQTSGTYIVVIESETVSQTFKIIKE